MTINPPDMPPRVGALASPEGIQHGISRYIDHLRERMRLEVAEEERKEREAFLSGWVAVTPSWRPLAQSTSPLYLDKKI